MTTDEVTRLKQEAAYRAATRVESGMIIGLGAGSTAIWAVRRIGERIQTGDLTDIRGIPASKLIEREASALGIPLTTLESHPVIDLTIDGADEVDPQLDLIKGGGGALLREKIIAQASRHEIIVIDESKLSTALGTLWAVPVEVVPFGWRSQYDFLIELGAQVALRQHDGVPFRTDQNNYILDCTFGPIADPKALGSQIKARAGIVEHGLFLDLAHEVIVASASGIRHIER